MAGKHRLVDGLVDEQRLGGVAHARALALGVDDDAARHLGVRALVDVDVAVADAGLDDRDLGVLDDSSGSARHRRAE